METWKKACLVKKYVDRSLQMDAGCEDIVSRVNAHQKMASAGEFNNQMDKMTHSVDSQPPSPAPCHCSTGTWTKRRWGLLTLGLNNMDFHSPTAAECQICEQQRPTLVPRHDSTPGVTRQLPGGRLTSLDHFLCGKDNVLFILILAMDLFFLDVMLLPKLLCKDW